MEDRQPRKHGLTLVKGTIETYFTKMHSQGTNGHNPRREDNGGGEKNVTGKAPKTSKMTSLTTTMKKKRQPRVKKMGGLLPRGAKSRNRGGSN